MFINVNKKYDWDNLSSEDIETLIKDKIQKEIDKIVHDWEDEGIRVEKARWGRHNIIKGKIKIELPKSVDAAKLTLDDVKAILEKRRQKKSVKIRKKRNNKWTLIRFLQFQIVWLSLLNCLISSLWGEK